MNAKDLRTFERVMSYVHKKKGPDFEYSFDNHFKIFYSNDVFSIRDWTLDNIGVPEPTEADLRLINDVEIENTKAKDKEFRDKKDPDLKTAILIKRIEALEKIINKVQ